MYSSDDNARTTPDSGNPDNDDDDDVEKILRLFLWVFFSWSDTMYGYFLPKKAFVVAHSICSTYNYYYATIVELNQNQLKNGKFCKKQYSYNKCYAIIPPELYVT